MKLALRDALRMQGGDAAAGVVKRRRWQNWGLR